MLCVPHVGLQSDFAVSYVISLWKQSLFTLGTAFQVTQLVMCGEWRGSDTREALGLCMGGCAQLDAVMRDALRVAGEQQS